MTLREAATQALESVCAAKLCSVNTMSSRGEMIRLMDEATETLRAALAKPERRFSCPICAGAMIDDADERDLDDMLVVRHLSPRKPGESLRSCVDRVINWDVAVSLDPAVSSAARALVESGAAREWQGLTDEELDAIYAEPQTHAGQYARAIEAALRERNA